MITREQAAILAAPFLPHEHEFIRGFIYVEEMAICNRIEQVDLSWEWHTRSITYENDMATVVGSLTICSVTRDGTGNQLALIKDGREQVGESRKGATTDAMKRAARLFGIGRYLLQCPDNVKGHGPALDKWLASLKRAAPVVMVEVPPAPAPAPKTTAQLIADVLPEYKPFVSEDDFQFLRERLRARLPTLTFTTHQQVRDLIEDAYESIIDIDARTAARKEL